MTPKPEACKAFRNGTRFGSVSTWPKFFELGDDMIDRRPRWRCASRTGGCFGSSGSYRRPACSSVWRELVRGDCWRVKPRGRFEGQLALFEGMAARERVAVLLALMSGERRAPLPRKAVERYRSGQACA